MSAKPQTNHTSSPSNQAVTLQLAEISAQGSIPGNGLKSSRSSPDKNDPWADNIHVSNYHEDPTVIEKLVHHNKLLSEADKFIDFVYHVDNQARQKVRSDKLELAAMNNSGVALKNSQKYAELKLSIEEHEAEIELKDLTQHTKSTQPTTLKHYEYACIGTESCLKQRTIPKYFLKVLKQIRDGLEKGKVESQITKRD